MEFSVLSRDQKKMLEALFILDDIKEVIWESDLEKSLSQMGSIWVFSKCLRILSKMI